MSVSFEKKETNRGVLTFTISQEQIKPELDRVFNSVKKTINVPGFRKGHLPRPVFNQKFGEEALYQDALNNLLPNAYEAAVKEAGIEVVAQPKIDVVSMEKGQDWTISAEVVTKPEVKLGAYKDLEVSVEVSKEVTDEDVDARIERERNNLAELVLKEGPAAEGDTVVIDFVGSVDGVEFDGGKGDNFSLGLGSGQFIPGFEDQLVGHKAGETVDVVVTFPEDYQAADLAGKEAKFVTTIHEVKEKEVPALDDELAKDIDEEVETLDELKEKYGDVFLIRMDENMLKGTDKIEQLKLHQFEENPRELTFSGFQPDFILLLQNKDYYLQIFIEPKGEQLVEKDIWKEELLSYINDHQEELIFEDEVDGVIIKGLKFYNKENSEQTLNQLAQIALEKPQFGGNIRMNLF